MEDGLEVMTLGKEGSREKKDGERGDNFYSPCKGQWSETGLWTGIYSRDVVVELGLCWMGMRKKEEGESVMFWIPVLGNEVEVSSWIHDRKYEKCSGCQSCIHMLKMPL